ncbi:MAG TPA: LytR C-terminal domain-containing protein [Frankiaceae bacterium]|jgi:hypothetical protein|nr:LytR C-terminal domain-containing protein [Frankiaceae bacterium]
MRGSPVPAAALRLLRYALPLCLVAASVIAVLGLLRVVGRPATEPLSQQVPSLDLGASSRASVPPIARPSPTAIPRAAPTPLAPLTAPVAVFNATGVSGLAGRTAAALRLRGVNVAAIGNLTQDLRPAATAVYYPPGIRGQAQTLAKLSGAATISPAPAGLGATGTLVLVLTNPRPTAASASSTLSRHVP